MNHNAGEDDELGGSGAEDEDGDGGGGELGGGELGGDNDEVPGGGSGGWEGGAGTVDEYEAALAAAKENDELEAENLAAQADADAERWLREKRSLRVKELNAGGCFVLARRLRPATGTMQTALKGLNAAWTAARSEGKEYEVFPVGQIGGKAWDKPFFKSKRKQLGRVEGEYDGAAVVDAPARLISYRLACWPT